MELKRIFTIASSTTLALAIGFSFGMAAGSRGLLTAPDRLKRERRKISSATHLAADLALVVDYLERGQSYFRAYQRGTHSIEENKKFLKFLEHYEKELAVAKKEVATLDKWVANRGSLDTIE